MWVFFFDYNVYMKSIKKTQSKEELNIAADATTRKKKQRDISRKYHYLKTVDETMLTYTFLRAQAEYICEELLNLKLGPFNGLYNKQKELIITEQFTKNFYVMENEYGEIVPDYKGLSTHLPSKILIN